MRKSIKVYLSFLLICAMTMNFTACTAKENLKVEEINLLDGINANKVGDKPLDEAFVTSCADFSLKLFKKSITENESSLISPLSVMLALAMTANGADGQTRSEMEELLGGKIKLEELNEYLHTYIKYMPSDEKYKLQIANSIWLKDDENQFTVEKEFLQTNVNYYGAATYKSAFDKETIIDINNWVKKNTDGMIDKIITKIDNRAVMYLINTLVFNAEWEEVYREIAVHDGIFNAINGKLRTVKMMYSNEASYIDTGKATGFIKQYKDSRYSFVALLPNNDIEINEYIASLTGEDFFKAISSTEFARVDAAIPKFNSNYEIEMKDILSSLGMTTAFDINSADFSKLGKSTSGKLFIGKVLHKTHITVNELGTKAGAVTLVEINDGSANVERKSVKLDRPFIYAIVDNRTNLPIFIGTVMDIND